MVTYLDRILDDHRSRARADRRPLADLLARAADQAPTRGFAAALETPGLSVIAEVKRRSPSRGTLAPGLDPAAVAGEYATGGAACLSVLTDETWFGGSPADLTAARAACDLPVLRKDFTVGPADVAETRIMGADAVLIIVAALDPTMLADLLGLAGDLRLDALVEVHDEDEAAAAVDAGARIVGVNQRDLVSFEVDDGRAERVAKLLPDTVVRVAESGIRGRADAERVAAAGYHAVLVGEALVTSPSRAAAVADLRVARR